MIDLSKTAQQLAMSYITCSIANSYLEESIDNIKKLGYYHRDIKYRLGAAKDYFDRFNSSIKWIFTATESQVVGKELCEDYEILKEACDRFMEAGVRVSAHDAWNNEEVREEGRYLCRVDGARGTDIMLLEWKNRQWLTYVSSTVAAGWLALTPGVKVVEVVKRINAGDINPMQK